jgi:alkylated DNA repair dioxygenase AlkB
MTEKKNTYFTKDNLSTEIQKAADSGVAIAREFITDETLSGLQVACSSLEYTPLREHHSGVSKKYFIPKEIFPPVKEKIEILEKELENVIKKEGEEFPELAAWSPSECSIQLYDQESYITPHRDSSSYRGIVIVASIQGETLFETKQNLEEPLPTRWELKEGDVVILRATGLNEQLGIAHAISGALSDTPRISIGFRKKQQNGTNVIIPTHNDE